MKWFKIICLSVLFFSFLWGCKPNKVIEKKEIYFPNQFNRTPYKKLKAYVVGVKDGDSFTVIDSLQNEIEVRMLYIDCPEKFQPYSVIARNFTASAIYKDTVLLYYKSFDRYDRMLALVEFSDNYLLNEELLHNGLAWHYTQYSKDKMYQSIEDSCANNRIGLFSENDFIAPWNWRED